jgi:hypothetical protein
MLNRIVELTYPDQHWQILDTIGPHLGGCNHIKEQTVLGLARIGLLGLRLKQLLKERYLCGDGFVREA